MKNNFLKLTALWMVVACFAACQHDVDVIGISEGLAKKNMLGSYAYTAVDSALMQVTKIEVLLDKDEKGAPTGYYRRSEARQGQYAPTDERTPISWETAIAENKLWMNVSLMLDGGEKQEMTWFDNQLHQGGDLYKRSASSEIDMQNTLYGAIENTEYTALQSTYYEHKDTIKNIGWKQKTQSGTKEQIAQAALEKIEELAPYMDTIAWYLRFKVKTHVLGKAYLDTVITGTDTAYVAQNVVWVNTSGKGMTYLTQKDTIEWEIGQINDRPMEKIVSNMAFYRQGETNTGNYFYHIQTWKKESYTEATPKPAPDTDSTYTMEASAWALTTISKKTEFEVLMKGTETVNDGEPKEDAFTSIHISGFNKDKGEATVGELKYTLIK